MGYMYDAYHLRSSNRGRAEKDQTRSDNFRSLEVHSEFLFSEETGRDFSMLKMQVEQANAEHGTKVIAVSSAVAGEGKSTISYILSCMLAQSSVNCSTNGTMDNTGNHGVLLIDGNLHRPQLHRLFRISLKPGLMEFASNESEKRIYSRFISNHSLNLITAGSIQKRKPDIWNMNKVKKLFTKVREHFKYILIDTPPVINHPETIALCKLVDGVMLVIKANNTRLEVVKEAKEQLENAEVGVLGAVLNERRYYIPKIIYKSI